MALQEFVRRKDQKQILELRGKIRWGGRSGFDAAEPILMVLVDTSVWIDFLVGRPEANVPPEGSQTVEPGIWTGK